MRKVIKILLGFISTVILALVMLPLALWLLLSVPAIQNFAVNKATNFASDKLGTTVTIDRIDIRLLHRVELKGFYVEDFNADTLLYLGRVSSSFNGLAMFGGRFMLGDVEVDDAVFSLRQNADSILNIKEIIDRIRREEPRERETPFKLTADGIRVNNMTFTFRKYHVRPETGGMNFDDFAFKNINISGSRFSVIGDSVSLSPLTLSFTEKKGLELRRLHMKEIILSGRGIILTDAELDATGSSVTMPHFAMLYGQWQDFGDFVNTVTLDAEVTNSTVGYSTIAYFTRAEKEIPLVIEDLTATLQGKVEDMRGVLASARYRNTSVSADYRMRGVTDITNAEFTVRGLNINSVPGDITAAVYDFSGKTLKDSLAVKLMHLGAIAVEGNFEGSIENFDTELHIRTALGDVGADMRVVPGADRNSIFSGRVIAENFDLGAFLGTDKVGSVTVASVMDGRASAENIAATAQVSLDKFEFNDYTYSRISMRGDFENRNFRGEILSSDPNINFDFDGLLDFNDSIPRYDFDMNLHRADLHALNFNKRDTVSVISSDIRAHGSGNSLDNLNGDIIVDDLFYVNHLDTLQTGKIRFSGRNSDHSKYLSMRSDFTDVEFRSRLSYLQLIDYFRNTLVHYLPNIGEIADPANLASITQPPADNAEGIDPAQTGEGQVMIDAGNVANYSLLSVDIKHTDNLARVFVPGLVVAEGTRINFLFNPLDERFSLNVNSEYIEKGNMFVTDLAVNSQNYADSISLFVRASEVYAGRMLFPKVSVIGGARDNRIYGALHFSDELTGRSALVGANALLGRDTVTGRTRIDVRTTPSHISINDAVWSIYGRAVMDTARVDIRNFIISGSGQSLRASGVVSAAASDTLHVDLRNFDLSVLTQFTERMGFTVKGRTNGHADLAGLKGAGTLEANILFDSVAINHVEVPDGLFTSRWDFENERARFYLQRRDNMDTVARAYFRPSDKRYMARTSLKGIDLSLLQPFFEGIMSDTYGRADAYMQVSGTGREVKLNGTVDVPQMGMRVDMLNVPYLVRDAKVIFTDNVMTLKDHPVEDPLGNIAEIDLAVDMSNFRNIGYDITIRPDRMLVMNTREGDNDLFYGRVFATGGAHIKGNRTGVNMDIAAASTGSSVFTMLLPDKVDVSEADFIVFRQRRPDRGQNDTLAYSSRRQDILTRGQRRGRRQRQQDGSMNINMTLDANPDLRFNLIIDPATGHSLTARGNGSLHLTLSPRTEEFAMVGDYQIQSGTYLLNLENIIEKSFNIEPGSSIQWIGSPTDAMLDISAVYRLKTSIEPLAAGSSSAGEVIKTRIPIDCRIMLTETLSQPLITFDIIAPSASSTTQSIISNYINTQEMMAKQFFFLLATGGFMADEAGGNIGTSATTATAFEFLSNQVSNWISSDKFNLGIRYNRRELSGTMDIVDEFGIDYSQQFFNNRLILEVEGSLDTGRTDLDDPNQISADTYVTWLLDRNGNFQAKFFSRKIDRYVGEKGTQETGLGVYYKEDFNNYRDIGNNLRDRFSGARKQRIRQAQAEADRMEEEMVIREDSIQRYTIQERATPVREFSRFSSDSTTHTSVRVITPFVRRQPEDNND